MPLGSTQPNICIWTEIYNIKNDLIYIFNFHALFIKGIPSSNHCFDIKELWTKNGLVEIYLEIFQKDNFSEKLHEAFII